MESELYDIIKNYEKPLSLYVFTEQSQFADKIIRDFSFGGGCVNDTIMHIANKHLPFGGVGHSGMGSYHGKYSFDTFSHKKSISKKGTWLDVPLRYAPYKDRVITLRKIFKWI
jgi:aldehyde dehydrogenase (NAD+)